jgi:hypothetical protein
MGDPLLFAVSLLVGFVLFVTLIVWVVRVSVRKERTLREEPFEEGEK